MDSKVKHKSMRISPVIFLQKICLQHNIGVTYHHVSKDLIIFLFVVGSGLLLPCQVFAADPLILFLFSKPGENCSFLSPSGQ